MTESTTRVSSDVRVGSATDGLTPFSTAERSLAAGAPEWLALGAVAVAAIIADQLTKHIVSSQLGLGDEVKLIGPLSIHHVQNSGIAFGLFSSATAAVIVLTTLAVGWMLFFFARSGSRHPVLPVALGLVIGGSVSNLVDRVQPRGQLHRRRRRHPTARADRRGPSCAYAFLTTRPARGSTRSSRSTSVPALPRSA